jgi:hypothetical protein
MRSNAPLRGILIPIPVAAGLRGLADFDLQPAEMLPLKATGNCHLSFIKSGAVASEGLLILVCVPTSLEK